MSENIFNILGYITVVLALVAFLLRMIPQQWRKNIQKKAPWLEDVIKFLLYLGVDTIAASGRANTLAKRLVGRIPPTLLQSPKLPTEAPADSQSAAQEEPEGAAGPKGPQE